MRSARLGLVLSLTLAAAVAQAGLDCTRPEGRLVPFVAVLGDTRSATNDSERYGCAPQTYDGGEVVFALANPRYGAINLELIGDPGLAAFLLPASCDPADCLAAGDRRLSVGAVPAGDYFVVVDGHGAATGDFELTAWLSGAAVPASVSYALEPGETADDAVDAFCAAVVTDVDLMFAVDTTASMGPTLTNIEQSWRDTVAAIESVATGSVFFGLAEARDYFGRHASCAYDAEYGAAIDGASRLVQPITDDRPGFATNLRSLTLGDGIDPPDAYTRAWFDLHLDPSNDWRKAAQRVGIMLGDSEPHSCDLDYCGTPRASTGADPGYDEVTGTADDLEIVAVMQELALAEILPLFLVTDLGVDHRDAWECWTGHGAGRMLYAQDGIVTPAIAADIRAEIEAKAKFCARLTARAEAGFEDWLGGGTEKVELELPARATFSLEVGPPAGTPPGRYGFTIEFVCSNGQVKAVQDVRIEVGGCQSPTGGVADSLRVVADVGGDDAIVRWSGSTVDPPRFNLHASSTADGAGSSSTVHAAIDGDLFWRDSEPLGAGAARFYAVYARDCDGSSIPE